MGTKDEWIDAMRRALAGSFWHPAALVEAVAPLIAADARRAALEEAANICEAEGNRYIAVRILAMIDAPSPEHRQPDHDDGGDDQA